MEPEIAYIARNDRKCIMGHLQGLGGGDENTTQILCADDRASVESGGTDARIREVKGGENTEKMSEW